LMSRISLARKARVSPRTIEMSNQHSRVDQLL
jgi:hypothetical protein